jgi:peptidoglycan/xylan/chitin deacetylase (PgdA/CDA1 family)
MRASMYEPIFSFASLFGIPSKMFARAIEMQESNLLVLLYHDVSEDQFRNHLHFLDKHFDFMNLDQLADALRKREFPADLTAVITFDDGLQSFYSDVFTVIKEIEIPVINYVTSGVVNNEFWHKLGQRRIVVSEKAEPESETMRSRQNRKGIRTAVLPGLTSEQLREVDRHSSITIGSHSCTHPVLVETSYSECRSEIFDSRKVLESILGHEIRHFAYPYGAFTEREVDLVKEAGYISAAGGGDVWITLESDPFSFLRKGAGPKGNSLHWLKYRIGK